MERFHHWSSARGVTVAKRACKVVDTQYIWCAAKLVIVTIYPTATLIHVNRKTLETVCIHEMLGVVSVMMWYASTLTLLWLGNRKCGGGEIAQSLASLSTKRANRVHARLDPLVSERWNSITVLLTCSHQCRRLVKKRPSMCYYVCVIMHVKDP